MIFTFCGNLKANDVNFLSEYAGWWYGAQHEEFYDAPVWSSFTEYSAYDIKLLYDSVLTLNLLSDDEPFYGDSINDRFENIDSSFCRNDKAKKISTKILNSDIFVYDEDLKTYIWFYNERIVGFAFSNTESRTFKSYKIFRHPENYFNIDQKTGYIASQLIYQLSDYAKYIFMTIKSVFYQVNEKHVIDTESREDIFCEKILTLKKVRPIIYEHDLVRAMAVAAVYRSFFAKGLYGDANSYVDKYSGFLNNTEGEDHILGLISKFQKFSKRLLGRWDYHSCLDGKTLSNSEILCFQDGLAGICFYYPKTILKNPSLNNDANSLLFAYNICRLSLEVEDGNMLYVVFDGHRNVVEKNGNILKIVLQKNFSYLLPQCRAKCDIKNLGVRPLVLFSKDASKKIEISPDFTEINEYYKKDNRWELISVMKKTID